MDDLTLLQGAATFAVLSLGTFLTLRLFQKRNATTIPRVPSWLPYIGSGLEYFQSVIQFSYRNREKYGNAFWATIVGREWLFVFEKDDITKMVRSNEKDVSMYQGLGLLAGKFLPSDDAEGGFQDPQLEKLLSRGKSWDGMSATTLFIHSLKPQRLRAWIPSIRQMLQEDLNMLPESGKVDLFSWCNDLISAITARVLLGDIAKDKNVSKRWIELVRIAEPESAFSNTFSSVGTLMEITFKGERSVYAKARQFLYPFVDAEIEKCIAGEPEREDASVLSALVRALYKQKLQNNAEYLRGARIRIANDLFFFTFAAITNSYAAAAWTLWHILRNTGGVGDRVLAELDQLGPDSDSLPEMEKLIYEIARLYTPGTLFRLVVNDFVLPSTSDVIPSGSLIACNVGAAHRNADAFSKPLEFDPTRFDEDRDERIGAAGLFLTFGAGTHPCVGRRFAVLEIALFVKEALQLFDWKLVDDDDKHQEDPYTQGMITNVPRHPKLDVAQTNSIWRPVDPVWAHYERKTKIQ